MKAPESKHVERIGISIASAAFESLGFAFREQNISDYGIDAHAELIEAGQPTGQLLGIQVKSGSSYLSETYDDGFVFRADQEHVDYWQVHSLPILICICDINTNTVYWQAVNKDTAIPTGKGYKFTIPITHTIAPPSSSALRSLLTPIVTADRYTIFKTEDTSLNTAKRYSFEVVLNGSMSKAEIASIVRQVTNEGQKRRYYRNHLVEGRWGDSDAHVVWTFIFPSAENYNQCNYICRSIWIHDALKSPPMKFDGENVGDNIIVDWNADYLSRAEYVSHNTMTKEDYLTKALPFINELESLLILIEEHLLALSNNKIDEPYFIAITSATRAQIIRIDSEISNMPYAPFECHDMDNKLNSLSMSLQCLSWLYSDKDLTIMNEASRLEQALNLMECARETLQQLKYEQSKVL